MAESILDYLSSGQSLPTEQPVEMVMAEPDLAGLINFDPSKLNLAGLNPLSDTGPAYDPNAVVRFDTGTKIGVPDGQGGFTYRNAAPVVFQPGDNLVLTDASGRNVLGSASTLEEAQNLVATADANAGKGWNLYRGDAEGNYTLGSQLFNRPAPDNSFLYGALALAALGTGLGALGVGAGGGAGAGAAGATGAGAAGTAAGTAGAGSALGALAPALGEIVVTAAPGLGLGTTAGLLGIPTAAGLASLSNSISAFNPTTTTTTPSYDGPEIVAEGARTPPLTLDQIATLPAATTLAPITSAITEPATVQPQSPDEIVVEATKPPPLTLEDIATLLPAASLAPVTSAITSPATVEPQAPDEIVVEGAKQPPPSIEDIMTLPAATTLAPVTSAITSPATVTPEAPQDTLLRDFMRYYSLGSGLLDALGVGRGTGASTATPYTSQLGALPNFSRGAFTPFTGDYEQYGFGPEFNFFGGAQTNG